MSRRLAAGDRLVVASHNPGKVREIEALLAPYGIEAVSAASLGLGEPEETGETFAQNAELKACAAARASGLPALADDSGLEVAALEGAPGVYSARWAGPGKNFSFAMKRLENALQQAGAFTPGTRRANFTCALTLAWPDGRCETFEGKVYGTIVWPPRGEKGFGYDPVFLPEGAMQTFGEMEPQAKHAISHRARAFERFVAACLERDA
ncbi:MAG: RdgB/HAM1 family non-canonical purine NTP pyrophosphatase [Methyloligellaceae bacterium]